MPRVKRWTQAHVWCQSQPWDTSYAHAQSTLHARHSVQQLAVLPVTRTLLLSFVVVRCRLTRRKVLGRWLRRFRQPVQAEVEAALARLNPPASVAVSTPPPVSAPLFSTTSHPGKPPCQLLFCMTVSCMNPSESPSRVSKGVVGG